MNTRNLRPQRPVDTHALLRQAVSLRVSSLRTRIMALDAFCAVAQSELEMNRLEKAGRSMQRIRHAVEEIELHLQEPQHVPESAVAELQALLQRAKPRIETLERLARAKVPR